MEFLQNVGLVIFASLFVLSGVNHLRHHKAMVGYTASSLGDCPVKTQVSYLGGWPAGAFLVAAGVGAAFGEPIALYALAGFLVVVTVLFHRNFLTEPGGHKGVALLGATLVMASHLS